MKKAAVGILDRVPVVCIVIGEAMVIYTAMAIAKLAFPQLDPLYSVWYRVGFMAVMLCYGAGRDFAGQPIRTG